MRRIAIIGCAGSGKTYVARHLGERWALPVHHLDGLYYDEHWRPATPTQFADRQRALVAGSAWVIDGHYASTLPIRLSAADLIIFLDLPAATCLAGIASRRVIHRGGQHPASGVYDRITADLVRYVLGYRRHMRSRVQALIAAHAPGTPVVVLRSRRAARRWVDTDERTPAPAPAARLAP